MSETFSCWITNFDPSRLHFNKFRFSSPPIWGLLKQGKKGRGLDRIKWFLKRVIKEFRICLVNYQNSQIKAMLHSNYYENNPFWFDFPRV